MSFAFVFLCFISELRANVKDLSPILPADTTAKKGESSSKTVEGLMLGRCAVQQNSQRRSLQFIELTWGPFIKFQYQFMINMESSTYGLY
jgi:hypothetical protein